MRRSASMWIMAIGFAFIIAGFIFIVIPSINTTQVGETSQPVIRIGTNLVALLVGGVFVAVGVFLFASAVFLSKA
jgi:hypothetical protein